MATIFDLPLEIREMIWQYFVAPKSISWTLIDQELTCQTLTWDGRLGCDQALLRGLSGPVGHVLNQLTRELRRVDREGSEGGLCEGDDRTRSTDETSHPGANLKQYIEKLHHAHFWFEHKCADPCDAISTFDTNVLPKKRRAKIDNLICALRKIVSPWIERSAMIKASTVVCKANARLRKELAAYWSRETKSAIYVLRSAQQAEYATDPQTRQFIASFYFCKYWFYSNDALDAGSVDLTCRTFARLPHPSTGLKGSHKGVHVPGGKHRTHFFWRRY